MSSDSSTNTTAWSPTAGERDNRSCLGCGAYVSAQFAKTNGDNENKVHRCPECCDSFAEAQYKASGREHPGYQPGAYYNGDQL